MTVLFMEGFDGHLDSGIRTASPDPIVPIDDPTGQRYDDWRRHWKGASGSDEIASTYQHKTFIPGYRGGQAINLDVPDGTWVNDSYWCGLYSRADFHWLPWDLTNDNVSKLRFGAWVKSTAITAAVPDESCCIMGLGELFNTENGMGFFVDAAGNGTLHAWNNDPSAVEAAAQDPRLSQRTVAVSGTSFATGLNVT